MSFVDLLRERRDAVASRWCDAVLATYPEVAARAYGRHNNGFANPVGHGVRAGVTGIIDSLVGNDDASDVRAHLLSIIKVRAVQEFTPAEAVRFVFFLKDIVRAEIGEASADPACAAALAEFDRRVDSMALEAFDVFSECRHRLFDLRINELKRQIPWAVTRMNRNAGSGAEPVPLTCSPREGADAPGEVLR